MSVRPPAQAAHVSAHVSDVGTMNDWIEERVDSKGRVYYVDHKTKTTQWKRPVNPSGVFVTSP